ncbi:amino-acid N-acetyltransferase [Tuwongella immobilis]|uniref:amino-acid N-acetyltransferase n=1 Tax=Tuwongella immobilis TaxID=692036 RepID=A0A6C2YI98_9BACT|nr:amino-acid N-acetyltransferase [Tuwongella immobilis]VIP01094.1 n-acetylglutamate synthase : Amino-acid N-acetyltransferase OS=Pedosphaera parvula (strain Ellin514) GN=Cflav_PD4494 PE=3 SV=1: AA_kinase: Acetyltransf_1 [Tuwongella immobilis]VTR97613.1 n-acetylglutamate synthase : Amino-acid N-acetyltransferase OS=Pedosphaera parvula (strain Ellin514) GN=Cflav_PD4494 PE=3 SV=1: AA_kinase: Acetyltransf_1 [Tuwongella immobilis]
MKQLTDLREILHYVPRFRDRVFVIAIDGSIVASDNFTNLMRDIAILRSLSIEVVLVHGAAWQVTQLAERLSVTPSSVDGIGITDSATLEVSQLAAMRVTQEILEGLAQMDLRGTASNAVVAHPAGILRGVDQQWTGKVERIDTGMLTLMLKHDIVPVLTPLGCDGEGRTYRLNSDTVAVEVAKALNAVKLIFLSSEPGVRRNGTLIRQMNTSEAELLLKSERSGLNVDIASKLEQAIRAAKLGVQRIHIIDGQSQEGLLAEVFSNEGVGTLIHTNEYQSIRQATKRDLLALYGLLKQGMETDELLHRSRAEIERQIQDFFVFETDHHIVACGALHPYPQEQKAELACLYVSERTENQGMGVKLMQYAENRARILGAKTLFCLSTQAINYFVSKGGFTLGTPDDLPPARRAVYDRSGRKSQVLLKSL